VVLVGRVLAQQRDHRHPDQQPGPHNQQHEHHEGGPRGPRWHLVVAAQPHLGHRRPDGPGQVLAELAVVEDALGRAGGQVAAEIGQHGPPAPEGGVQAGQDQRQGGQHRRHRQPAQQRLGLLPLTGHDDRDDGDEHPGHGEPQERPPAPRGTRRDAVGGRLVGETVGKCHAGHAIAPEQRHAAPGAAP
jgi:hypothetical protein